MGELLFTDCIKVQPVFRWNGQLVMNRHYFQVDGDIDPTSMTLAGSRYIQWWVDNLQGGTSNQCELLRVIVTDVSKLFGVGIDITPTTPKVGGSNQKSVPSNVTFAVKYTTGYRGRSFQGRTYHVGLTVAHIDGNQLLSEYRAGYETAYTLLRGLGVQDVAYSMVIASASLASLSSGYGVWNKVIGVSIDPNLDSQRRRLTGRGA